MPMDIKKDARDIIIALCILYAIAYMRMSHDFTWGGYVFVCGFTTVFVVAGVVILRVYQNYRR